MKFPVYIFIEGVKVQLTSYVPVSYRTPNEDEILMSSYCSNFEALIQGSLKVFSAFYIVKNKSDEIKVLFVE